MRLTSTNLALILALIVTLSGSVFASKKTVTQHSQHMVVGKIKHTENLNVYDPEREQEVLRRIKEANHGPLDNEGLQSLFERIINECRRIEKLEREKE